MLIAGNWKMNGLSADAEAQAKGLAADIGRAGGAKLLICPPATLIAPMARALADAGIGDRVALGGQDCHTAEKGAHTGDVSAWMLKDIGCSHVIVGHSERRIDHGESDDTVKAKAEAALEAGLIAIVCVGETEAQRQAEETELVLSHQLRGSMPSGATRENTVIAYEPVWAIGTGLTPSTEDVAAVHAHIGTVVADFFPDELRILYGGSVKPENAGSLMAVDGVDGALVGGASLKFEDFLAIAEASGAR